MVFATLAHQDVKLCTGSTLYEATIKKKPIYFTAAASTQKGIGSTNVPGPREGGEDKGGEVNICNGVVQLMEECGNGLIFGSLETDLACFSNAVDDNRFPGGNPLQETGGSGFFCEVSVDAVIKQISISG